MALTAAGLKSAILAQLPAATQGTTAVTARDNFANELATAIISYLTSNAVVSCTIASGTIVTNGSASTQAGPAAPVVISGSIS